MEGIVDGAATDRCFVCGLLYPRECDLDCPRCGRRMRYEPASLMDDSALEREIARRLAEYRAAPRGHPAREALAALLSLVHRFAPDSLRSLAEQGGPAAFLLG